MIHRKRLTIDDYRIGWRGCRPGRGTGANALATLAQDCAVLPGQLWRRFTFFPGGAFGFADGDHEPGLLTGELAPARRPTAASDLGEIFAHFDRQCKPLGSHHGIVNGLR